MKDKRALAEKLRDIINDISYLIDDYTKRVCPSCTDVCCKQEHAYPEERDIIYLEALGINYEPIDRNRPMNSPCQFLGETGCIKPRYQRPIRCTWYFCEALLKEMENGSQKRYRYLIEKLKEIIDLINKIKNWKEEKEVKDAGVCTQD